MKYDEGKWVITKNKYSIFTWDFWKHKKKIASAVVDVVGPEGCPPGGAATGGTMTAATCEGGPHHGGSVG